MKPGNELAVYENPISVDNDEEQKESTYEELKDRSEGTTEETDYMKLKK